MRLFQNLTFWNSLECKEFSGKLQIQSMDTLLSHIAFSSGNQKGDTFLIAL